jgi:hypothetical protein
MQRKQVIDRREASETSYGNSSDLFVYRGKLSVSLINARVNVIVLFSNIITQVMCIYDFFMK